MNKIYRRPEGIVFQPTAPRCPYSPGECRSLHVHAGYRVEETFVFFSAGKQSSALSSQTLKIVRPPQPREAPHLTSPPRAIKQPRKQGDCSRILAPVPRLTLRPPPPQLPPVHTIVWENYLTSAESSLPSVRSAPPPPAKTPSAFLLDLSTGISRSSTTFFGRVLLG